VLQAVAPLASDHAPAIAPGLLAAGAGLVAAATVAGVWLARRRPGQQQVWLGAAAGALLVIAGVHVLPDAWSAARAAGIWPIAVPATAIAAFLLAGFVARGGCACQCSTKRAGGRGAAAALALHRFLEGSAMALVGSATVIAALGVHALGEGLAVGALLASAPRRRTVGWLAVMCLSPVVGAVVTSFYELPAVAEPFLLAVAGGVLAQAARVSLRAACQDLSLRKFVVSGPAAAGVVAAVFTVLAVQAVG
jgi:ZIP family zinc transporter